jgi:hypothetical protein
MSTFTESTVQSAALAWLESPGWQVKHGPAIPPDVPVTEGRPEGATARASDHTSEWPISKLAISRYLNLQLAELRSFALDVAMRSVQIHRPLARRVRAAGVEVKAASSVTEGDFRGLRRLRDAAGDRFAYGVVLYDGEATIPFGERLHAVPVRALWEGP